MNPQRPPVITARLASGENVNALGDALDANVQRSGVHRTTRGVMAKNPRAGFLARPRHMWELVNKWTLKDRASDGSTASGYYFDSGLAINLGLIKIYQLTQLTTATYDVTVPYAYWSASPDAGLSLALPSDGNVALFYLDYDTDDGGTAGIIKRADLAEQYWDIAQTAYNFVFTAEDATKQVFPLVALDQYGGKFQFQSSVVYVLPPTVRT